MANQKITDLNKLNKLSSNDLLIVVDRDSQGNSTSPTGETMAIEASTLAGQLAEIHQGDVGISLKDLADVPNNPEDWAGGYIKVSEDGTTMEFTDAPGASEVSVPYVGGFLTYDMVGAPESDATYKYQVGDVLTRDTANNVYKKANSSGEDNAEAIGIIRRIKGADSINPDDWSVNIVFGGYIEFDEQINVERETTTADPQPLPTDLEDGKTYFLGRHGTLSNYDPAESIITGDTTTHVSKPLLVATGVKSGVLVNYRGLMCEKSDEPNKFIIQTDASCSSIKVGDVVRVKRTQVDRAVKSDATNPGTTVFDGNPESVLPSILESTSGGANQVTETQFVLANAASQGKSDAYDDAYGCDILGLVTVATPDFFEVQTAGMVTFTLPSALKNRPTDGVTNRTGGIFKQGHTYYLSAFDITPDELTHDNLRGNNLAYTVYDYASNELDDYFNTNTPVGEPGQMQNALSGIEPFRNTTINNPFTRDPETMKVMAYSKPVFYAVAPNQILLLNQPTYPQPFDECNAIDPSSNTKCFGNAQESRNYTIESVLSDAETRLFLNTAWPSAEQHDKAIVTRINNTPAAGENKFTAKTWVKVENNTDGNFGKWTDE